MNTLGVIWCDETYALDPWHTALERLRLDRSEWRLLILCRGSDQGLTDALSDVARAQQRHGGWGRVDLVIDPQRGSADRYVAIGQSWQRLNELRGKGNLLLGWEADSVPQADAAERLLEAYHAFPDAAYVTAVQYDRRRAEPRLLLWNRGVRYVYGPDDACRETVGTAEVVQAQEERWAGVMPVWAAATGFGVFRPQFLDGYTFGPRERPAHDLQVGDDIAARGMKVRVRWDVKCLHVGPQRAHGSKQARRMQAIEGTAEPQRPLADTALILTHYGQAPARLRAVKRALPRILAQNPLPEVLFLELLFPGEETAFPELRLDQRVRHVVIEGEEHHQHLMQKEALYNIGAGMTEAEHLIFGDADAYSPEAGWLEAIRDKLAEDSDRLVQGFSAYADTIDAAMAAPAVVTGKRGASGGWAPGLYWGISRRLFWRMGGWNPWCIPGSGDRAFLQEHVAQRYDQGYRTYRWFEDVLRPEQPQAETTHVPHFIIHEHHGACQQRAYVWSRVAIEECGGVSAHVALDASGLLAWRDPDCVLRRTLARKAELLTEADLTRVLQEERTR